MADDKISWQIEIDGGEKAVKTLDDVQVAAKEIDLSNKTLGSLDMMMRSLLETHRAANKITDALKMEGNARRDNLRLTEKQRQEEERRAQDRAQAAKAERDNAVAGLRNIGIGAALGGAAMVASHASSGFADTLQGQQSQVYGQLLNRQVAAIFAPLLEEKTKYVSQMTQWLQGLHEPQRESIRQMTVFATSMGTLGYIVPKLTKGIAAALSFAPATNVGGALAGGSGAMAAGGGAAAMAGPIGIAIAAGVSLLASTKEGRSSLIELGKALEPAFESLADAMKGLVPLVITLAGTIKAANDAGTYVKNNMPDWAKTLLWRATLAGQAEWIFTTFNRTMGISQPSSPNSNGLSPVPRGLEDIGRDFERILEASVKIDLQQDQLDTLKSIDARLAGIQGATATASVIGPGARAAAAIGF